MPGRLWQSAKWRALALRDGYPSFADYRTLLRQERMSRAELDELRRVKTRRLVETCLRDVPYYGELMHAAGLRAEAIQGPKDLGVLPLLDKPIIRREGRRLLNQSAPPSSYYAHTTSGSTGMPLDFFRGREYDRLAVMAGNMRAWSRMGWRPGDAMARFWSPRHDEEPGPGAIGRLRRGIRRWLEPPDEVFSAYTTSPAEMETWIPRIRALRPPFLYGYATILTLFANFLAGKGQRLLGVRGIASTGESLLPAHRRLILEVCPGAVVVDMYGSREIPGIASECRAGTMHINSDLVHVEHLPMPHEPGRHRLVITALDNTVHPFIRYDIGDYGSPLDGSCSCGLAFPGMRWEVAKILDSLVSPEGRIMYGGWFEGLMYRVRGVHAYQFRQTTPTDITLFVVPTGEFDDSTRLHLAGLQAQIRSEFSATAVLRIERVDSIPLTATGKHRFVVSDVRHPAVPDPPA
jgi:phenylacetate-CoA ligase